MKKQIILFCVISMLLSAICSCNNSPEGTPHESDKETNTPERTITETDTSNFAEEDTLPPVEYMDYDDETYCSLAIGPRELYNYGPGWQEKDFDVFITPLYYMIDAAPRQEFIIPMDVLFTLGYKTTDFELEVTLADGQDQVLEILSVDRNKALDPNKNCEGITVRALQPGVANVYIKVTYTPTGDNAVHQVIVVVQKP